MKYVASLSPRGIFTHGNSSTKAGLTASAVKDGDDWVLEAGALVLADKGLCAVDELDKMSDQDREALHGAMEQQEIDVAKAGIVAKLLCRCSLLAAANPKHGRFDTYKGLSEQLNLPPTLLSRFDLIYPMLDIPDKTRDKEISEHIVKTHTGKLGEVGIPIDLLKKYIAHAKSISPSMSDDALDEISNFYLTIRGQVSDMGVVPITARTLEGLIRLSEAAARMRLSHLITREDAKLAISLVDGYLRQLAYDQTIKSYDADKVIGRYPRAIRNIIDKLTIAIHNCGDDWKIAQLKDVEKYMKEHHGILEQETNKYIEFMIQERLVFTPRIGLVKMM
jgi:replicative DNA helicase Mcm